MHHDHTLDIALGDKPVHGPMHTDSAILAELQAVGPGCGQQSPAVPYAPLFHNYRCSRHRRHQGRHVAGTDMQGHFIAEWDDDRTTDLADL